MNNNKGDEMNKEQIETAVNLGKQIVIQAVETARRKMKTKSRH